MGQPNPWTTLSSISKGWIKKTQRTCGHARDSPGPPIVTCPTLVRRSVILPVNTKRPFGQIYWSLTRKGGLVRDSGQVCGHVRSRRARRRCLRGLDGQDLYTNYLLNVSFDGKQSPTDRRVGCVRTNTRCYFNVRSKADISQLNLPRLPNRHF